MSEPLSFVSTFVWSNIEPLRVVVHHGDGSWQFSCGTVDRPEYVLTMHADHVFERFPNELAELRELPPGYMATREYASEPWHVEPDDDEA